MKIQILVALFVLSLVQSAVAGPLNQLNSLIRSKYGEDDSNKKRSLKQEREQLYEAYNLLHSLAQVRVGLNDMVIKLYCFVYMLHLCRNFTRSRIFSLVSPV